MAAAVIPVHVTRRAAAHAILGRKLALSPLAIAALIAGGFVATIIISHNQAIRRLRQSWRSLQHDASAQVRRQILRTIIGLDRTRVAKALGLPRARDARTWYFPLDFNQKLALAITFDRSRVARAQIISAPHRAELHQS